MDQKYSAMNAENRKHRRQTTRIEAIIIDTEGLLVSKCVMVNVSAGGARLRQLESIEVPDKFALLLTSNGTVRRQCEVAWRSEKEIGVKFISAQSARDQTGQYKIDA